MTRQFLNMILVATFAMGLAACGDTWKGAKKDTGENLESTGEAIEDAGKSVKK
ncbi:MAG: entericidin EcnAB [Alphaproteobacteria bacterium]